MNRSIIAFLLVVSFGILFAGCSRMEEKYDTFSFTEDDAEEVSRLLDRIEAEQQMDGTGELLPLLLNAEPVVLDALRTEELQRLRAQSTELPPDAFRVMNEFLNIRSAPSVSSNLVAQLKKGDGVSVVSFPNASWAKVRLKSGQEAYASTSYIAKVVSEDSLETEKERYKDLLYVNFSFLNVRAGPQSSSDKLGELKSAEIVKPIAIHGDWVRIPFGDRDGFVSREYLRPFMPNFIVRQDTFNLPTLHMRIRTEEDLTGLLKHVDLLLQENVAVLSLKDFEEILFAQEQRDERLSPRSALLVLSDIHPSLIRPLMDGLLSAGTRATMFIRSHDIGSNGEEIAPALIEALSANGFDVQSAGHTGEDLRSLTNSQVTSDLSLSKKTIEQLTGKEVFAVLYPQGGVNDRVAQLAEGLGFLLGVTLNPATSFTRSQFLRLPSILLAPDASEDTVRQYVTRRDEAL
jgi:hypothetical protein